jgi:hypothetical protein
MILQFLMDAVQPRLLGSKLRTPLADKGRKERKKERLEHCFPHK